MKKTFDLAECMRLDAEQEVADAAALVMASGGKMHQLPNGNWTQTIYDIEHLDDKGWFSICPFQALHDLYPKETVFYNNPSPAFEALRSLHCVDYRAMSPEVIQKLPILIKDYIKDVPLTIKVPSFEFEWLKPPKPVEKTKSFWKKVFDMDWAFSK